MFYSFIDKTDWKNTMIPFGIIFQGNSLKKRSLYELKYIDPIIKKTFEEASENINYNLWKLIHDNSDTLKNVNEYIQASILTYSIAIYRFWKKQKGRSPIIMAGHSLGEYSALVCSQTIKLSDALKLVTFRAKLMYKTNENNIGLMQIIIGLNKNDIISIINKFNLTNKVEIACNNSINQIVIAGYKKEVQKIALYCKKNGAKHTTVLPYNIISHCKIMKKPSEKFKKILKRIQFKTPFCKVINNVDVKCEKSKIKISNALIRQLYNTVCWKETIEYIKSKQINLLLEIGSGNFLSKLNKKINNLHTISLNNSKNVTTALEKTQRERYEI